MNLVRIVESILQPIGILWLGILAAAVWSLWRKNRGPALLLFLIAGVMAAIGSTSLVFHLLASLERPYAKPDVAALPAFDAVVMLGGTLSPSENDSLGFEVADSMDRSLTAIELIRQGKAKTLILGGGGGKTTSAEPWTEGALLEQWIQRWNLGRVDFVRLAVSANTREEAVQVQSLARERQWNRIALVTSGYHMKRAEALFRKLDIPVTPVACDFVGLSALGRSRPFNPIPQADPFRKAELYFHEIIGWWYYRWRGWV